EPMLAKLIVWAPSRSAAVARIKRALSDFVLLGVYNNIEFLGRIISSDDFMKGEIDTSFLDRHPGLFTAVSEVPPEALLIASRSMSETSSQDVWSSGPWRNSGDVSPHALPFRLLDSHHAEISGKRHRFYILHRHGSNTIWLDGRTYHLARSGDQG